MLCANAFASCDAMLTRCTVLSSFIFLLSAALSFALDVGDTAKDFALKDKSGSIVTLSSLMKGCDMTILEFMSIYCDACKKQIPKLDELTARYSPGKVKILSIALASQQPDVDDISEQWNIHFPILADPDKITFYLYGIHKVPQVFLIDRSGIIRYRGTADKLTDVDKIITAALQNSFAPLQPGDGAPPFELPDAAGAAVNITFDDTTAHTLLGFFIANGRDMEPAALLSKIASTYPAGSLRVYAIIDRLSSRITDALQPAAGHGLPVLVDPGKKVFQQYAVDQPPELIIISKTGHIKARAHSLASDEVEKLLDLPSPVPTQLEAEQATLKYLRLAMPEAVAVSPVQTEKETIYIGTDEHDKKTYARFVKKDILCEVCTDVEFICAFDQDGKLLRIILIRPFEVYGSPVDTAAFLHQFIGRSYHQPFVPGINADIITGATKSCKKLIEGLNETEEVFAKFISDPAFDATFRKDICYLEQAEIELALHLYLREHKVPLKNIKIDDLASYCTEEKVPRCPSGGAYNIIILNGIPRVTCTVHGLDPRSSMVH